MYVTIQLCRAFFFLVLTASCSLLVTYKVDLIIHGLSYFQVAYYCVTGHFLQSYIHIYDITSF